VAYPFALPDLGEGVAEGEVVNWHVEPGQWVQEGDPLVAVETDKTVVEIPSPVTGRVGALDVREGDRVPVGTTLVVIETASAARPRQVQASPRVRRLASELGVDLTTLGQSVGDRPVTEHDVNAAVGRTGGATEEPPRAPGCDAPAPKQDEAPPSRQEEHQQRRGGRGPLIRHLARVQQEVPAVTIVEECDFTALDEARSGFARTALLLKVASAALADVPELNATFADGEVTLHQRHDIGLAVQAPNGLVVPVARGVDSHTLDELEAVARRLAEGVQANRLELAELTGSTFTVTDAGPFGGVLATPLVNAPEVAILGVHRAYDRPVVRDGQVVIRRIGNLSCTFDHRAVDGFQAGMFLLRCVELIEKPGLLGGTPGPGAESELADRLAAVAEPERAAVVGRLVREHAAAILGYPGPDAVPDSRPFKDLGIHSLTAVELRNRLARATGLRLPSTLVFDYPTPAAVAGFVLGEVGGTVPARAAAPAVVRAVVAGDPVAVVGIGCRFPGGAGSPGEFWELLAAGRDVVSGFPGDRGWDLAGLFDPDPGRTGTSYVREGGFLAGAADFDAGFFGISPREALAMDPQQRVLLEVAWEALEDAGIDPGSLRGTQAGVFAGIATSDYVVADTALVEGYRLAGRSGSVVSGRIAYALGLEGPAVTVDTACSSSLVALHLACQSLRSGECSLALAGGVTVMSSPEMFIEFARQRGLAPDGRCKSFAAGADGTGWSEGAGLLVLERLSDAVARGRRVLGLVRGSAVNQDGASNGLTAPNGPSQERVIRAALASAGLGPGEVDAVEGHGTGTVLGDPIEARALLATYGQRGGGEPLWLGSVKSNIGHSSAAAGVAGVIKMLLAARHGLLPATLHVDAPTPHADWSAGRVRLLADARPWPRGESPRRAGVSAFGISGTNAHVIIQEAPLLRSAAGLPAAGRVLAASGGVGLVVSGHQKEAVRDQARRVAVWWRDHPGTPAADVAVTLAGRGRLPHRAVVTGSGREELLAGLDALSQSRPAAGVVTGMAAGGKTALVFSGQGSQWAGMGRGLYEVSEVFAESVRACGRALAPFTDWSLEEMLLGGGELDRVEVVQPVLWAVMVSLAAWWRHAGVVPVAVIGHSQGEIAAACAAGALSLEDGARVVALRSRALAGLAGSGAMAQLAAGEDRVRELAARWPGRVWVAALNGPAATVVSGDRQAVEELVAVAVAEQIEARLVAVDYASHSPRVEALRERLEADLAAVAPGPGRGVAFCSTLAGGVADAAGLDGGYWYRSLREPVRFTGAVRAALGLGVSVFVEATPHPVLADAVTQIAEEAGVQAGVAGTLRRGQDGPARMLAAAAEAEVAGAAVNWGVLLAGGQRADLPPYAFQRQRYWLAGRARADVSAAGLERPGHPLLAAGIVLGGGGRVWSGRWSLDGQPWLAGHAVLDTVIVPGTVFAELAWAAGREMGAAVIREVTVQVPLVVPVGTALQVQVSAGEPGPDGDAEFAVYARPEGAHDWVRHASGILTASEPEPPEPWPAMWPPPGAEPVSPDGLYARLAGLGLGYGPAFRGVAATWQRGGEVYAEVELPEAAGGAAGFGLHPALFDAALHPAAAVAGELRLPFSWRDAVLYRSCAARLRVRVAPCPDGTITVLAADEAGTPVVSVRELATRPVTAAQLRASAAGRDDLWQVTWTAVPVLGCGPVAWAVIGDADLPAEGGRYPDVAALARAVEAGVLVPDLVLVGLDMGGDPVVADGLGAVAALAGEALGLVQAWLGEDRLAGSRLLVLTRGAVAAREGEVPRVAGAAAWGLVRSAQSEHPGRFVLADVDMATEGPGAREVLAGVLAAATVGEEPQLAVRAGQVLVPRLARAAVPAGAGGGAWRVEVPAGGGTLGDLLPVGCPRVLEPLCTGQVRVAVRAAGLNFRDVLVALGMVPDGGEPLGAEGAGTVLETGPGVTSVAAGDRVTGLLPGAFGPVAVTSGDYLVKVPDGWSWAQAASVPVAFLTAYYALVDLAALQAGERVVIHAAAGGVGMAAVQLARYLGAEVLATASPGKWPVVTALGVPPERVASSRTLEFAAAFGTADVVLNSLAGEFVDVSLGLLGPGGRFVEMGKTDIRDPARVAADHPGVSYRAFDLLTAAGPDRLAAMLAELSALFRAGVLAPLPVRTWDVRDAARAMAHMREARHTGKIVLTVPQPVSGRVLVTGGTGGLGGLLARHLAGGGRVRELVLTSRSGPAAAGAAGLAAVLAGLGCGMRVEACDAADRGQLAWLLERAGPFDAVIHAAAVLDDGLAVSLDQARLERALAAKAGGALHLHELTRGQHDLTAFVLFSSAAGVFGAPGQGNYAAANAALDALAAARRAAGLPGVSLAWGLWAEVTGATRRGDQARLRRAGLSAMDTRRGLALFDAAAAAAAQTPVLVPAALDLPALRDLSAAGQLPALLRGLVTAPARAAAAGESLAERIAGQDADAQRGLVLEMVKAHAAVVLGHGSSSAVEAERAFRDMGFDSLAAVEFRNRLATGSGLRLPATATFDYPTPVALTDYLLDRLRPATPASSVDAELDRLAGLFAEMDANAVSRRKVVARMQRMIAGLNGVGQNEGSPDDRDALRAKVGSATAEEVFDLIDREFSND
jgi:acyl transferase domain-containing protein/pyruvate/2-oxoglutarate dehydrogenase complex dihydrolipoamide acyltransferase (E2) component/acyl carrier protein